MASRSLYIYNKNTSISTSKWVTIVPFCWLLYSTRNLHFCSQYSNRKQADKATEYTRRQQNKQADEETEYTD